jgi:hypothetical protein
LDRTWEAALAAIAEIKLTKAQLAELQAAVLKRTAAFRIGDEQPLPESSLLHNWRPGDEMDAIPLDTAQMERIRAKAWMNTAKEAQLRADKWQEQCAQRASGTILLTAREVPLACPGCGGENLHHDVVDVRTRVMEDGAGARTIVHSATAIPDVYGETAVFERSHLPADSKLWNGRRDELAVEFWCEHCESRSVLHIMQHKGTTLLWMVAIPEEDLDEPDDAPTARAITYCSFAGGEPERCLGIVILTGEYDMTEALRRTNELGFTPAGECQMLAVAARETDYDMPDAEFEAMWANRDRLISLDEAKQLFGPFGMQTVGEHRAEGERE